MENETFTVVLNKRLGQNDPKLFCPKFPILYILFPMMRIAVFFAAFAVVFSFPLKYKRIRLQRIYSAVDPSTNNIFKDYIDVKIESVTEKNLNRIFGKMDENTKEMLRMFEAMNIKIDNNAKEMNIKIDNNAKEMNNNAKEMNINAKEMNIKIDNNAKEMNEKIDKTATKLGSLNEEFRGGKLAASILAGFLGILVATNFGTFLKDVVQPFFTK